MVDPPAKRSAMDSICPSEPKEIYKTSFTDWDMPLTKKCAMDSICPSEPKEIYTTSFTDWDMPLTKKWPIFDGKGVMETNMSKPLPLFLPPTEDSKSRPKFLAMSSKEPNQKETYQNPLSQFVASAYLSEFKDILSGKPVESDEQPKWDSKVLVDPPVPRDDEQMMLKADAIFPSEKLSAAKAALAYYNKQHGTQYKLVHPSRLDTTFMDGAFWWHCNFLAAVPEPRYDGDDPIYIKVGGDSSSLKCFFAELKQELGSSKHVTCCCILDGTNVRVGCKFCKILHPTSGFQIGLGK